MWPVCGNRCRRYACETDRWTVVGPASFVGLGWHGADATTSFCHAICWMKMLVLFPPHQRKPWLEIRVPASRGGGR
eukprot:scaffold139_cov325-Pavlova_lutheri.AAC.55